MRWCYTVNGLMDFNYNIPFNSFFELFLPNINISGVKKAIILLLMILTGFGHLHAQQFEIEPIGGVVLAGTPVQLRANFLDFTGSVINGITNDRVLNTPLNIGFDFSFFGTLYNRFLVAANGFITFDQAISLEQRNFQPGTVIPYGSINPNLPKACIFGPMKDWNHAAGGNVTYRLHDTGSGRKLILTWCDLAVPGATGRGTFQIILNDDNSIENHLAYLPYSPYNNNRATQGIVDITGNIAVTIPGRNNTNNWIPLTNSESWVYTPSAGSYTVSQLPEFTPFPIAETITWFELNSQMQKIRTLGNLPTVTVTPQQTTVYMAELSTCWGEVFAFDTIEVKVTRLVPNVFEPNSAIVANSTFGINVSGNVLIGSFSLQVFNRWGEIVFETSDASRRWNGKKHNTGLDCPTGVYTWVLTVEGQITNKGMVTLIR